METDTITQGLDIINLPEETRLSIESAFSPMLKQAEEWRSKAESLVVSNISQVDEMKNAREARLALKNIRTDVEKKRKELKEDSLRKGKAIDGMANVIKYLITPIEKHLQEQEDFAKNEANKIKEALRVKRVSQLSKFDVDTSHYNLEEMTDDSFASLLESNKMAFELKKEQQRIAEEDRIVKEKKRLEEENKIRLENERLRKEAENRDKEDRRRKAAEEKESRKQDAILKKEIAEKEKLLAEIAKKEKLEKEIVEAKLKKEKQEKEAQELLEKESRLAPDKVKLEKLASQIVSLRLPDVNSKEAKEVLRKVQSLLNKTSNFIKEQTIEL